jgi:hypothetical protein
VDPMGARPPNEMAQSGAGRERAVVLGGQTAPINRRGREGGVSTLKCELTLLLSTGPIPPDHYLVQSWLEEGEYISEVRINESSERGDIYPLVMVPTPVYFLLSPTSLRAHMAG